MLFIYNLFQTTTINLQFLRIVHVRNEGMLFFPSPWFNHCCKNYSTRYFLNVNAKSLLIKTMKKGPIPYWYRPRIDANLRNQSQNQFHTKSQVYGAGRYNLISSKYITPVPPATGLVLLPRPRVIVSTLERFTPWSANTCRSIDHSVQVSNCVAVGLL